MYEPPSDAEIQSRNVRAVVIFGATFIISAGVSLSRLLRGDDLALWPALTLLFLAIFAATIYRWVRARPRT